MCVRIFCSCFWSCQLLAAGLCHEAREAAPWQDIPALSVVAGKQVPLWPHLLLDFIPSETEFEIFNRILAVSLWISTLFDTFLCLCCSFPPRRRRRTLPVNWLKRVKRRSVKRWVTAAMLLKALWFSVLIVSVSVSLSVQMSQFIVQCLNPYRKPDCKLGRISNTEDFKHLARKVRLNKYM